MEVVERKWRRRTGRGESQTADFQDPSVTAHLTHHRSSVRVKPRPETVTDAWTQRIPFENQRAARRLFPTNKEGVEWSVGPPSVQPI